MLELLDQLAINNLRKRKIREVLLGTRQMLRVSLCLSTTADLLLLDEPFRALDEKHISIIAKMLTQISDEGTAVLLTSHHDTKQILPNAYKLCLEEYWALRMQR